MDDGGEEDEELEEEVRFPTFLPYEDEKEGGVRQRRSFELTPPPTPEWSEQIFRRIINSQERRTAREQARLAEAVLPRDLDALIEDQEQAVVMGGEETSRVVGGADEYGFDDDELESAYMQALMASEDCAFPLFLLSNRSGEADGVFSFARDSVNTDRPPSTAHTPSLPIVQLPPALPSASLACSRRGAQLSHLRVPRRGRRREVRCAGVGPSALWFLNVRSLPPLQASDTFLTLTAVCLACVGCSLEEHIPLLSAVLSLDGTPLLSFACSGPSCTWTPHVS